MEKRRRQHALRTKYQQANPKTRLSLMLVYLTVVEARRRIEQPYGE